MAVIPYLSQGQGVEVDPLTGLPKKKKAPTFTQGQVNLSLAQNPLGTFGPSSGVNYGAAQQGIQPTSASPDYKALIAAALGPLSAQLGAEGVSDLTSRNNQFVRTLGQFGEQFDLGQANQAFGPEFVGESGLGELLPQANKLAGETTGAGMSFKARASKAHTDAVRQIRNTLASRGLLRSGELGHQLQEQQTQFDTGQYDARQQVQDYLGAVNKGYTDAVRARQAQLDAATREEAGRQAQLNPMTGVPQPDATPAALLGPPQTDFAARPQVPWPWDNPPPTIFPKSRPAQNAGGGYRAVSRQSVW